MKTKVLILCIAFAFVACEPRKPEARDVYRALVSTTEQEYRQSPARAYEAEVRFAEYVKDSMQRGIVFPDKTVLVWTYPRIALAAEYCGRRDEAARMYAFAEEFHKQVYSGGPIDRSGRFKTLREVVIYMDRNAGVPWLKEETTEPNKAPVPTVMSVTPAADAPVAPATTAAQL